MTTKSTKKVLKKVTKKNMVAAKKINAVVLTLGQAKSIAAFLSKNGKNYKFLDAKINAINA